MSDRVPTGVPAIDRQIGGGIPAGSILTFRADPASQVELFFERLTTQRETLYLTVDRPATAVSASLGGHEHAPDLSVRSIDGDAPTVDTLRSLTSLPEDGVLIVDSVGPLERVEPGQYRAFLDELGSTVSQTNSVAVLHALKHDHAPAQRHRTEHVADVVFDLVTETRNGHVETRLLVPKFRGGRALREPTKVELTDRIAVDTSRDIA